MNLAGQVAVEDVLRFAFREKGHRSSELRNLQKIPMLLAALQGHRVNLWYNWLGDDVSGAGPTLDDVTHMSAVSGHSLKVDPAWTYIEIKEWYEMPPIANHLCTRHTLGNILEQGLLPGGGKEDKASRLIHLYCIAWM